MWTAEPAAAEAPEADAEAGAEALVPLDDELLQAERPTMTAIAAADAATCRAPRRRLSGTSGFWPLAALEFLGCDGLTDSCLP